MKNFFVTSQSGIYRVRFISDLKKQMTHASDPGTTHVIIDREVFNLYKHSFPHFQSYSSFNLLNIRENRKTLTTVTVLVQALLKSGIDRSHTMLVIGGGQLEDIGSFTAHILFRGINWIYVPTTLLSQADSCIGSKSALNVGRYKNQVGAFHPPVDIAVYPPFIRTLAPVAVSDGIGEILKHAFIAGGKTYTSLTSHIPRIPDNMTRTRLAIYESLMVKKEIIEKDEFDRGLRRLLNYGHTFGHALEGYTKNRIPHGTAVSIGMDMANFISMKRRMLGGREFERMSTIIHSYIPRLEWPVTRSHLYMDYISHDKKVVGNKITAILCRGIGNIVSTPLPLDRTLIGDVKEYGKYFRSRHENKGK